MAAEDPADRVRGDEEGAPRAGAPFDLGDSRDLAAAVRAAWGGSQTRHSPPPEIPRPPLDRPARPRLTRVSESLDAPTDPLAQLRDGRARRLGLRVPTSLRLAAGPPKARTLAAAVLALVALLAAAAFPLVTGSPRRTPVVAEQRPASTTTSIRVAPTTAFTYPPETIVPPDTTAVPTPGPAVAATESPTAVTAAPARTATTSRQRTTATTRSTSQTTRAPAPTTTQPPPPPPDDGSGSGDSSEPPPYP